MAKVSAALVAKLKKQVEGMRSGLIISNKAFTKAVLRLLPTQSEVPGHEYLNLYFVAKQASTTSPRTLDLPCPVLDALDAQRRDKVSEEDKKFSRSIVNVQREFWIAVVDRADLGTPDNPRVRIHRAKRDVYQAIVHYMLDEDDGEDITDALDGRDFRVKKTGSGKDTEWKLAKFFDKTPIAEDDDMVEALVAAAKTFDVPSHFFDCKFDVVEEIYQALTGEVVPDEYKEAWKGYTGTGTAAADPDADETPAESTTEEPAEETVEEPAEEPAEETVEAEAVSLVEANAAVEVGDEVTFEYTDEKEETHELTAKVTELTTDKDGGPAVDAEVDGVGVFTVGFANFKIVPQQEPEPEPEPAPPKKTGVQMKSGPKAKAAAAKPKPGVPSAASKIRNRLKAAAKKKAKKKAKKN